MGNTEKEKKKKSGSTFHALYESDLLVMEEFWKRGTSSAEEMANLFEECHGWDPRVTKKIVKGLVRFKKYLKKKPFQDSYTVIVDRETGLKQQIDFWINFRKEAGAIESRLKADEILEDLQERLEYGG